MTSDAEHYGRRMDEAIAEIRRLRAENENARAALQWIATYPADPCVPTHMLFGFEQLKAMARHSLGIKPEQARRAM